MTTVPPGPRGSAPVVAVDGPSGVGKGTIARAVARRLAWHFLDSGALYRILALAARDAGVDLALPVAVARLASSLDIKFVLQPDEKEEILLNGRALAAEVRAETTGQLASTIAVHPEVRAALLARQRDFRRAPGLVADGRDMGTVVFPDAALKIFLDASAEERARRRLNQLRKAGIAATLAALFAEIRERDVRDRSRQHSPLRPAHDAVVIDTTELSIEDVLGRVNELIDARGFATKR